MPNKLYSPPQHLLDIQPSYNHNKKWNENQTAEAVWIDKVIDWAKTNGSSEYAGKEIRFPVADGNACYIVLSVKPLTLIHLPINDRYQSDLAKYLPLPEIKKIIRNSEALAKLFSKK